MKAQKRYPSRRFRVPPTINSFFFLYHCFSPFLFIFSLFLAIVEHLRKVYYKVVEEIKVLSVAIASKTIKMKHNIQMQVVSTHLKQFT